MLKCGSGVFDEGVIGDVWRRLIGFVVGVYGEDDEGWTDGSEGEGGDAEEGEGDVLGAL